MRLLLLVTTVLFYSPEIFGQCGIVYRVEGGGSLCPGSAGTVIMLTGSQPGLSYQLKRGPINVGEAREGTGDVMHWSNQTTAGTYTVVATNNQQACSIEMNGTATINVHADMNNYAVSGGGVNTTPGTLFSIALSGSQVGINYQLQRYGVVDGEMLSGTGSALNWSGKTDIGTYSVVAVNPLTNCHKLMSGEAKITFAQDNSIPDQNYIQVTDILVPSLKTASDANLATLDQKSITYDFFDGLGRNIQTVNRHASPKGNDIVLPVSYDEFGRQNLKYLPYISEESGVFKIDPVGVSTYAGSPHEQFYNNGNADKVTDDTRPFQEIKFEASPLQRPLKEYGAGALWGPQSNNKYVEHNYLTNIYDETHLSHERIIAWVLDANGLPARATSVEGVIKTGGYYSSGQIFIKGTTDEQGHQVREYSDKLGHIILKKVQAVENPSPGNDAHWAQTYYIYNDLGNLAMVLSPEATSELIK